jgi:hypothetical protein
VPRRCYSKNMADRQHHLTAPVATGLHPRDEGPLRVPPADGEGYLVEPPSTDPVAALATRSPSPIDAEAEARAATEQLRRESQQFSLSGLLLLVTLLSVMLGPIVWLPLPAFAGFVGLGSLVLLTLISLFNTHQAIVRLGWWLLVGLYLAAATAAYIHS